MPKRPVWRPSDIKWGEPRQIVGDSLTPPPGDAPIEPKDITPPIEPGPDVAPLEPAEEQAPPAPTPAPPELPDNLVLAVTIDTVTHTLKLRWLKDLLDPEELAGLAVALDSGTSFEVKAREGRAGMSLSKIGD